jgi:hypothetical protein
MGKSIGIGVVLWFVAAMTVQYGGPAGWFRGMGLVVMYGVCLPLSVLTVWMIKALAGLGRREVLGGVVMGTVAATMCDGLAMNWARGLYGVSGEAVLPGAAWILWGAGWILLAAYWEGSREGERLGS